MGGKVRCRTVLFLPFQQNHFEAGVRLMKVMTVTAALWAAIGGLSLATAANAAITHFNLHIPREPLDAALRDLAHQTGVEVGHFSDQAQSGLLVGPVQGSLSPADALGMLLHSTGLSYRALSDRAYIVATPSALASAQESAQSGAGSAGNGAGATQPSSDNSSVAAGKEGKSSPSPGFRVAQVAQGAGTSTDSVKSARPQSASERSPLLQEIIVTAQKYRQRAFDVPISLDVVTAQDLQNLHISSLQDLQYDVPGLYMQQVGGLNRITLRGVGNGIGNGALVGQYIDEADITGEGDTGSNGAATGDVDLNDVNRVEVLRGPQGTLYGDGSMGGVIRIITNEPVLDRFQMSADAAELFTQYGAPSQQTQVMLNAPLISGELGLRFAGDFEHDGGWIDEPQANLKNVNDRNLVDMRLEAVWQPNANLKINAMQIARRDAYGLGLGESAVGNIEAPLIFGLTTEPNATQTFNLSNITVDYDSYYAKLVSSSTYFTHNLYLHNEFLPTQNATGVVSSYSLLHYQAYPDENLSEELRLSNAGEGPWQWMVGGFYKDYFDNDDNDSFVTASLPPMLSVVQISELGLRTRSKSTSEFVNTSYKLSRRLTIGAGVRHYSDQETYNTPSVNYFGYLGLGVIAGELQQRDFTSTDPRYFVQYQITRDLITYASASKGFRQGGFNPPGLPPYQPEVLWSYDAGTKMRFLNNSLLSDVDLFYGDYSNYVIDGLIPATDRTYEANVGTAHLKGVDADLKWRVRENWQLGVNGEYVDPILA